MTPTPSAKPPRCTICLEDFDDLRVRPYSTRCGHLFCEDCVNTYIKNATKCPFCRQSIKRSELIKLHFDFNTGDEDIDIERDVKPGVAEAAKRIVEEQSKDATHSNTIIGEADLMLDRVGELLHVVSDEAQGASHLRPLLVSLGGVLADVRNNVQVVQNKLSDLPRPNTERRLREEVAKAREETERSQRALSRAKAATKESERRLRENTRALDANIMALQSELEEREAELRATQSEIGKTRQSALRYKKKYYALKSGTKKRTKQNDDGDDSLMIVRP